MSAGVALCVWALLGPLRVDRLAVSTRPLPATANVAPAPSDRLAGVPDPGTTPALPDIPDSRLARPSERLTSALADFPLVAGDRGPLVTQMQGALVTQGYWVGLAGGDGGFNDDTLTALGTFQDNNALPVQQICDQECWTTLGLTLPE